MPRHKEEVIKILTITNDPVQSVTYNVTWQFSNLSRKGAIDSVVS